MIINVSNEYKSYSLSDSIQEFQFNIDSLLSECDVVCESCYLTEADIKETVKKIFFAIKEKVTAIFNRIIGAIKALINSIRNLFGKKNATNKLESEDAAKIEKSINISKSGIHVSSEIIKVAEKYKKMSTSTADFYRYLYNSGRVIECNKYISPKLINKCTSIDGYCISGRRPYESAEEYRKSVEEGLTHYVVKPDDLYEFDKIAINGENNMKRVYNLIINKIKDAIKAVDSADQDKINTLKEDIQYNTNIYNVKCSLFGQFIKELNKIITKIESMRNEYNPKTATEGVLERINNNLKSLNFQNKNIGIDKELKEVGNRVDKVLKELFDNLNKDGIDKSDTSTISRRSRQAFQQMQQMQYQNSLDTHRLSDQQFQHQVHHHNQQMMHMQNQMHYGF